MGVQRALNTKEAHFIVVLITRHASARNRGGSGTSSPDRLFPHDELARLCTVRQGCADSDDFLLRVSLRSHIYATLQQVPDL